MKATHLLAVLVALSLVLGSLPAAAMASTASAETPQPNHLQDGTEDANQSDRMSASTGQQLSTVLEVTDDEVTNAIEESSAEAAFASAAETERATLLAARASTLRDRTDELADDRRAATAAYEAENVSAGEYAQRIAVLSGQASTISVAFDRLDQRAESVPASELEAAGYDTEANAEARSQLQSLTGSSARALLDQYTGLSSGEFSVDRTDGVSIEVESDDGERTRELERDQPGDGSFVVGQSEAVATAEEMLSTDRDGNWTLRSAERDSNGYFELEFSFYGPAHTGEAEVSVDGQTGEVFEFEEELEPRDRDDDDEDETPLSITIVSGEPAPGATVTLQVTAAGEPVADAVVEIDDQEVGTTDENGQLTVTLPDDDEVDIEAESGEREGELELSLEGEREEAAEDEREESDDLSVTVVSGDPAPNATVTIEATQNGGPVANASVTVNDERVGQTNGNGQLTVTLPDEDEVEIEVESGDSEGELEFEFEDDAQDDEAESDENDELSVTVVSGDPAPNETVTIEVTQSDEPVANASVTVNDERVGQTDENGQLTVTLPDDDEVDIEVESGDSEGELEFEFEEREEEEADEADEGDDEDGEEEEADDEDEDEDDDEDDDDDEEEDDE